MKTVQVQVVATTRSNGELWWMAITTFSNRLSPLRAPCAYVPSS